MKGAEIPLPAPVPERREALWKTAAGETELELPSSLYPWVAALVLWPLVDEPIFKLVARCYGNGRAPEWTFLSSLLLRSGLVESDSTPVTFTIRAEWQSAFERGLVVMGGADAVRAELVVAWLDAPDRDVAAVVAGWASDLALWGAVDAIWMALGEEPGGPPLDALAVYRKLPVEARRARPMLTYASGVAESMLAPPSPQNGEATLRRLLLDSALLHSDWSAREDTDAAVGAGTIRIIGERRLPSTQAGQSLQAAWRTKQEIDTFIDTRSRAGKGPGRTSHAIFRAFSARLALFLGDPMRAVGEAHWAALLSDWEPASTLAEGVEALALSVSSDDRPTHRSPSLLEAIDEGVGVRGFKGMGQVLLLLADGNDALRRLDRDELDRVLVTITAQDAAVAGVWSVRTTLVALRSALWGDAAAGVDRLAAEVARQSVLGREHEEPFGSALLTRARVLLLTKMGAFGAATQAAETLAGSLKVLPTARIQLWAGQFARAIRTAETATYEAGLEHVDRSRLTLLRGAAALLAGTCGAELRESVSAELMSMVSSEAFLAIALLPRPARDALVDLFRRNGSPDDPGLQVLLERLGQLNDAQRGGVRSVRLTEREAILMPLLAGEDTVPEIARKLHVSVNTVRKQVVTLREKFGADNRAELITKATSYGVIH